ncbi:copper amine oxidase N-terminal domain-containing protein [Paenibacillus sp. JNUCC31]|uniref:copper amine oxidase N-terminal domain-containing protein n=1 Tax=Paenibacillus sp. JNUCC-31 TaxID=2777983 RepID=UPI001785A219|nr:copper amine oxidase N-terminal domain-containing protein [Paenibacillus sp. JNUCC-31]QOS77455.1 copper amine oxidase N-terminal domain-containing protein [Paenibacillus sp. JNUCC-31]
MNEIKNEKESKRMKKIAFLIMVFILLFVSSAYAEDRKVEDIQLMPAKVEVTVGEKIDFDVALIYDEENMMTSVDYPFLGNHVGLSKTDYTISKPHILKLLSNGMLKITGVGSSKVTVKVGNIEKSVVISGSLKDAIDGGYIKEGVTFVPMTEVFKALGGSVTYIAQQGNFDIKVGSTTITLPKTGTKATLNGEPLTLKSPLLIHNGVTLFPASVLSDALDGALTYNAKTKQMQISMGKGTMAVNIEQPAKPNNVTATTTPTKGKLYAVPASGDMKGWSILKGHPYEKSTRVYFKVNGSIVQIHTKDISKVDLNKKVTWTDLDGKKHTNTIKQLYIVFGKLSNEYSSELLYKMFGETYSDWISISSVNAEKYVDQYLEQQGLI